MCEPVMLILNYFISTNREVEMYHLIKDAALT